jgi:hypothetical protein
MVTAITSISQNISMDINEIDGLLDIAKKKESKDTTKQLESLLIDYILANMKGDTAGTQGIKDQISSLLSKYSGDIEKANDLMNKLKAVANDPTQQTQSELDYLNGLITTLKHDAISGQMDGF